MAVHTLRIESDADWCTIEIRSAATWARGPGRTVRFEASGEPTLSPHVEIDDRAIRFRQRSTRSALQLVIQVATNDDRVSLHTTKGSIGFVRVTSAANARVNDRAGDQGNPLDLVLFLDPALAAEAGAARGDPALA